jgi:hypothetical protein
MEPNAFLFEYRGFSFCQAAYVSNKNYRKKNN